MIGIECVLFVTVRFESLSKIPRYKFAYNYHQFLYKHIVICLLAFLECDISKSWHRLKTSR